MEKKSKTYTDFHCHILPAMDFDGSDSVKETYAMTEKLREQGVTTVCATPHYYPWKEDMGTFLSRREKAYAALLETHPRIRILPGAEVQVFPSLVDCPVDRMCIGNSNVVMLEMPEGGYADWIIPTIENTVFRYGLVPVIAHLERYGYPPEVLRKFAGLPRVFFQITVGELQYKKSLKTLDVVSRLGVPVVLGSDAHNISSRPPRFDFVTETLGEKAKFYSFALKRTKALIGNALYAQPILENMILGKH